MPDRAKITAALHSSHRDRDAFRRGLVAGFLCGLAASGLVSAAVLATARLLGWFA